MAFFAELCGTFPLPFEVGICSYSAGAEDSHGNQIESWADPVATPAFWYSPDSSEPAVADRVIVDLVVVVEYATPVTPYDRMVVLGKTYEVVGEPGDFEHGPFGFTPNRKTVNARRVDG